MSKHYRSIWISDIHLGTWSSKAKYLLEFLKENTADNLYLVGDIIDCWRLSKGGKLEETHRKLIKKFIEIANKTNVVYLPGNHDSIFRDFEGMKFEGITIKTQLIHKTADGRKFLVLHGDQFDKISQNAKWLSYFGDWLYDRMLRFNIIYNWFTKKLGYDYWSPSKFLKNLVKIWVSYISHYDNMLQTVSKNRGLDGVICGHIHRAEIKKIGKIVYCNDGDWVESCTALVEDYMGYLKIIEWKKG